MPKYDKEDSGYDGGGDSVCSIFYYLIASAAGYICGGRGGIVGDLIDFLKCNDNAFESGYDDNKAFSRLLQ
jgi:hypothetical protein